MARRFRGEGEQPVDGKGRVSVPAAFRRVIEACDPDWSEGQRPSLTIVYGGQTQKQLLCYTTEAIDEIDRRIDRMKVGSVERNNMQYMFNGLATQVQVFEDGRIVLPILLRKKLDLDDKAYFIAAGDHFEIWKPETYAEVSSNFDEWVRSMGPGFDPMSTLPELDD